MQQQTQQQIQEQIKQLELEYNTISAEAKGVFTLFFPEERESHIFKLVSLLEKIINLGKKSENIIRYNTALSLLYPCKSTLLVQKYFDIVGKLEKMVNNEALVDIYYNAYKFSIDRSINRSLDRSDKAVEYLIKLSDLSQKGLSKQVEALVNPPNFFEEKTSFAKENFGNIFYPFGKCTWGDSLQLRLVGAALKLAKTPIQITGCHILIGKCLMKSERYKEADDWFSITPHIPGSDYEELNTDINICRMFCKFHYMTPHELKLELDNNTSNNEVFLQLIKTSSVEAFDIICKNYRKYFDKYYQSMESLFALKRKMFPNIRTERRKMVF